MKAFAALVKRRGAELRKQGITKAEIARRYRHDPATLDWHGSGVSAPSLAHMDALASVLEVHPNELRRLLGFPLLPGGEPVSQADHMLAAAEFLAQARISIGMAETHLRAPPVPRSGLTLRTDSPK